MMDAVKEEPVAQDEPSTSGTAASTVIFATGQQQPSLKRKFSPTTGASSSSDHDGLYEDRDGDIVCPICFQIIQCAYMTECGHSFCKRCIEKAFETMKRCPKCGKGLNNLKTFPNFALDEIITKRVQEKKRSLLNEAPFDLNGLINDGKVSTAIPLTQIDTLLKILQQKKQTLLVETQLGQSATTLEFLQSVKERKTKELNDVNIRLEVVESDMDAVQAQAYQLGNAVADLTGAPAHQKLDCGPVIRSRLAAHGEELEEYYFRMRCPDFGNAAKSTLQDVQSVLSKYVKYQDFKQLAKLNYTSDMYNQFSIVSSIEFDKDADYFAIAGVTKKIKIYDYNQVISDTIDVHQPVCEMASTSKISCLAWNTYHKCELASSDYEGRVSLWDPFTCKLTRCYQEHEKRCWCVDFNRQNPQLLASGSDDSRVKIWSTRTDLAVLNIEAKANVCCVKFNPSSSYHLAFGSADHCVHYYDLRQIKEPLITFRGHQKAVSYAKFMNSEEIVSASTDSQLKLWNVKQGSTAVRTFTGHQNEKNFVGLSSDADYIACGSEDNSLCVYYKGLSKVLLKYKFDVVRSAWQRDERKEDENTEFVSAVSWVPNSNALVAANSQGIIKILELV